MTVKTPGGGLMSILQPIANSSHSMKTWSLLPACAAGEAFLLYAILIAHTLSPVTALLIGHNSGRQSTVHRYQEIFNWDGLIPTMLGSLLVVAVVWSALQLTAARALPKAPLIQLQMALTDPTSNALLIPGEQAD
jgi:hypothetical protein